MRENMNKNERNISLPLSSCLALSNLVRNHQPCVQLGRQRMRKSGRERRGEREFMREVTEIRADRGSRQQRRGRIPDRRQVSAVSEKSRRRVRETIDFL